MKKDSKALKENTPAAAPTAAGSAKSMIPPEYLAEAIATGTEIYTQLNIFDPQQLTPAEHRKMKGTGENGAGFIERVDTVAGEHNRYAPAYYAHHNLTALVTEAKGLRKLQVVIRQIDAVVNDMLLRTSNDAYQLALIYYNSVRDLASKKVTGAQEVFDELKPYFDRPSHSSDVPTKAGELRDFKALQAGTKDGKMVIEHHSPQLTGGSTRVEDTAHKPNKKVDEEEEGENGE